MFFFLVKLTEYYSFLSFLIKPSHKTQDVQHCFKLIIKLKGEEDWQQQSLNVTFLRIKANLDGSEVIFFAFRFHLIPFFSLYV